MTFHDRTTFHAWQDAGMTADSPRAAESRPRNSLSLDAVLTAAVDILDADGERGLTFRVLAQRLHTGAGAIYWYVSSKDEILRLACDCVLAKALPDGPLHTSADPLDDVRQLAARIFDALDQHPWAGRHLVTHPGQVETVRALDRIGQSLAIVGLPRQLQFFAATAVMNYVLGVGSSMATVAETVARSTSREAYLSAAAQRWQDLEADCPFLHSVAADLRSHDDRAQFTAGLDLLLAGIDQAASGTP